MNFFRTFIFLGLLTIPALAFGQSATKGIGVIKARTQSGQEIELYKDSYALVIGASEYQNGWSKLYGVKRDVKAVKSALESQGFNVTVVSDPTREDLRKAFDSFISEYGAASQNRILIYYSGHGHTMKLEWGGEMGYIVPVDAPVPDRDRDGFLSKAMDMEMIEVYAKRIRSKHAIFLFDSCFSGSIFALSKAAPAAITYKTSNPVRQFITAGSAEEEVPDESIFRTQFVAAINGEGDLNKDGYVTGSELGEFLQTTVVNYSYDSQHPQYGKIRNRHLDKGDFVFALNKTVNIPHKPVTPGPVVLPQQGEASFDDILKAEQAQRREAETWRSWQIAREGEYAKVKQIDDSDYLKPKQKKQAWERFLSAVSQNNPHSTQDDDMRSRARDRIKYWDGQRTLAMAKIVKKPSGSDSFIKSLGMKFVYIKSGTFMMGTPDGESGRDSDEKQHRVTLTKGFHMQTTEVTVGQWRSFVQASGYKTGAEKQGWAWTYNGKKWIKKDGAYWNAPGFSQSEDCPVTCVSWNAAQAFIKWLNGKEGKQFRLPTEAEWEYACRAGSSGRFCFGDNDSQLGQYAWYISNSGSKTHPVAQKKPNSWGLYDMHGNVWEWCQDWYGNYPTGSVTDPTGPSSGSDRVRRGGSWNYYARYCRSANRNYYTPDNRNNYIGFRLSRTK